MKPALLILAAGMGSRYGGLKQMDQLGPNGETIMDYSVYDAVQAGFGKVVFVIRKSFAQQFKNMVIPKYSKLVELEFVEQELDKLPEGFTLNPERVKPWGTGHAMLMAKDAIDTPFAVINADDFYGRDAFRVLAEFFKGIDNNSWNFSMAGFSLGKTLSESGGVSRGICTTDTNGYLTTVVEHHNIKRESGGVWTDTQDGTSRKKVDENAYCSMNFWGFTPQIFKYSEDMFKEFLEQNINEPKKEFYIPFIANRLIETGKASVKVLPTSAQWFGVTFKEDRALVVERFASLAKDGIYPSPLFK